MIARADGDLARCWAQLGCVPENSSSREAAARLMGMLLDEIDTLNGCIAALLDGIPEATDPRPVEPVAEVPRDVSH